MAMDLQPWVKANLSTHAAQFKTNNRIWTGGYQNFWQDVADYDALLTAQGISAYN